MWSVWGVKLCRIALHLIGFYLPMVSQGGGVLTPAICQACILPFQVFLPICTEVYAILWLVVANVKNGSKVSTWGMECFCGACACALLDAHLHKIVQYSRKCCMIAWKDGDLLN